MKVKIKLTLLKGASGETVSSGDRVFEFHLRQELDRTLGEEVKDKAELAHPRAVLGQKRVWGRGELIQAKRHNRRDVAIID